VRVGYLPLTWVLGGNTPTAEGLRPLAPHFNLSRRRPTFDKEADFNRRENRGTSLIALAKKLRYGPVKSFTKICSPLFCQEEIV
jgi:hypothetical protein